MRRASEGSLGSRRGAARRLRFVLLLAAGLGATTGVEAAWDFFGDILLSTGWAENPRLLETDEPASLRGGQMTGTSRLRFGARSRWERTDFEFTYSPYGEIYEESDLNQLSHALGLSWAHRYTPRLSLSVKEDFNYNPRLPTDPNATGSGGALVSDSSIVGNDFNQTLSYRTTQKSSLAWTYRNIARIYSSDQLLDTSVNALGMEYSRTFGRHVGVSTGYELGLYSFHDGLPPPVTPAMKDFCKKTPLDPNCTSLVAAAAQPPAEDQGFDRHRAYAGYAYDFPAGLHFAFDGGYDFLEFRQSEFGSVSEPFVRSSLGWNGTRVHISLGYEQGLDEGGGILTGAELKRGRAEGNIRITDSASLDLSVSRDVRKSLDNDAVSAGTTLTTLRGGALFTYELTRTWALIAFYTNDWQTATGTSAVPTESRASRFSLGASWTFERRNLRSPRPPGGATWPGQRG